MVIYPIFDGFICRRGIILMSRYFCVLTIIDLFVLSFMCILTKLSESLNKKQKRGFFFAFIIIAFISILEVITLVVDGMPKEYRWLNIVSNYLGFGLSPVPSICLIYALDKKSIVGKEMKIAMFFEIAFLIFLAISIPFGLVFSVSADNIYSRGPYFYIYIIVYFLSILYLLLSTIITSLNFQNRSKKLIYPLGLFLLAETIIQILTPDLHVSWLCITLLSVLYFIYCNEMWHQLDGLTGLLSQDSYLNSTSEIYKGEGVLIVFDVDDFKLVNDKYGHLKGDACLSEIADCIKRAYSSYGYCYRIGGDEFCVLLTNKDKEAECLDIFLSLLEERRSMYEFIPTVSYGSSYYANEEMITVKDRADKNMYKFKHKHKTQNR